MKVKKITKNKIFATFIFLLGLGIFIYPIVSQYYYKSVATKQVEKFNKDSEKITSEEVAARVKLAQAYNETLDPSRMADPYTEEEKQGVAEYARMLEVNEQIGNIKIPKINEELPIYAGTGENVLQRGVGHLEGTSLPIGGASTHSVLTAHRGLPSAKLFTNLDKLEKGDKFYVRNLQQTLAYEVDRILTVEPNDFEKVRVENDKDYVTLLTCTPYMINSHRLLVRGHRVPYDELIDNSNTVKFSLDTIAVEYLIAIILLICFAFVGLYVKRRRKNKKE